jgi:heat shock protein HtpX
VPEPSVRVVGSERPESMTIGGGDDAVLLVSSRLVGALPEAELEAVLAHEVAHLANGDSRVMGAAL